MLTPQSSLSNIWFRKIWNDGNKGEARILLIAIPRLLNNFCGAFPNFWSKFAQSACEQSLCTVSICICWLLQTWFSSRCLLLITSQIFRFSKRYFHCTAQLWVTTFYFSLWFLLLWWRSAQVSSNTLAMTEFVILTSEHSQGRKRNKYCTHTFPMGRWGPTETCTKSMPAYERSQGNRRCQKFDDSFFYRRRKSRIRRWTKIVTYAFRDIEASQC